MRDAFRAGELLMHPLHPLAGEALAVALAGVRHVPRPSAALADWEALEHATRGRAKV